MSGSLEVRQFLMQQADSTEGRGGVPAQRNGAEPSKTSEEQIHRARLAVARGAQGPEDCRLLLDMLGLTDEEGGVPPVAR